VHNFIFLKHNAYSTERLTSGHKEEKIDPNLLKSYWKNNDNYFEDWYLIYVYEVITCCATEK
jgi:hypothetical protein